MGMEFGTNPLLPTLNPNYLLLAMFGLQKSNCRSNDEKRFPKELP
jgi:hypothetical protein